MQRGSEGLERSSPSRQRVPPEPLTHRRVVHPPQLPATLFELLLAGLGDAVELGCQIGQKVRSYGLECRIWALGIRGFGFRVKFGVEKTSLRPSVKPATIYTTRAHKLSP